MLGRVAIVLTADHGFGPGPLRHRVGAPPWTGSGCPIATRARGSSTSSDPGLRRPRPGVPDRRAQPSRRTELAEGSSRSSRPGRRRWDSLVAAIGRHDHRHGVRVALDVHLAKAMPARSLARDAAVAAPRRGEHRHGAVGGKRRGARVLDVAIRTPQRRRPDVPSRGPSRGSSQVSPPRVFAVGAAATIGGCPPRTRCSTPSTPSSAVAASPLGPMCVLAGARTGKTRAITTGSRMASCRAPTRSGSSR